MTSRGCAHKLDYIQGLGTDSDLAHPDLQEQGRPARGRTVRGLPRLLDHRLHPGRPAPRHQRRPRQRWSRRARARHEGLLRHHHEPHRRRDRLPGGRPDGVRLQGRRALPDRSRHAVRRPRLRRARAPSRPLDPATSFPYHPVLDPAEQNLKVPAWLNDVTLYHNRGDTTFTGENSQYGDFFGLDDLFTENPRVVDGMIDIYKTWVKDFGIDGFRIDTMKHVNDEFWQQFGPGDPAVRARSRASTDFFMFGEVALDGSGAAAKSFTSHYTTHDEMQAVLDFPFQDAARELRLAAAGATPRWRDFFVNDDWYTDADSNAYELPTFLGNHDMGRIGCFVDADNPGAARRRAARAGPARARADVLLPRQPGRLLRRRAGLHRRTAATRTPGRRCSPAGCPSTWRRRPDRHRRDPRRRTTSSPTHPLYQTISRPGRGHPGRTRRCATAPSRSATPSDGPGVFAFSRIDRDAAARVRRRAEQQRDGADRAGADVRRRTAPVPAGLRRRRRRTCTTARDRTPDGHACRRCRRSSTSSAGRIPPLQPRRRRSACAAGARPRESRGRMHGRGGRRRLLLLRGDLPARRSASGGWQPIGTDDNAPYRVFHDVGGLPAGHPAPVPRGRARQRRAHVDGPPGARPPCPHRW